MTRDDICVMAIKAGFNAFISDEHFGDVFAIRMPNKFVPPSTRLAEMLTEFARLVEARTERELAAVAKVIPHTNEASAYLATAGDGWQPIEAAPKNSLIDIGFYRADGQWVRWCECHYDEICGEWRTFRPAGVLISINERHVTHWMPLPAPPAKEDKT